VVTSVPDTREVLTLALQGRLAAIGDEVAKLIDEGKQCQSLLDHMDTIEEEKLAPIAKKMAEKYGGNVIAIKPIPKPEPKLRPSLRPNISGKVQIEAGDRFGSWKVVEEVFVQEYTNHQSLQTVPMRRFLCVCDCGEERVIYMTNLRTGASRSCGRSTCR
jgi:hypothetical protein